MRTKKNSKFKKKNCPPKPPSKVAHNRPPTFFFSTGTAAQTAQKHKSRTPKSPLMQDWVFRLGRFVFFHVQWNFLAASDHKILWTFWRYVFMQDDKFLAKIAFKFSKSTSLQLIFYALKGLALIQNIFFPT